MCVAVHTDVAQDAAQRIRRRANVDRVRAVAAVDVRDAQCGGIPDINGVRAGLAVEFDSAGRAAALQRQRVAVAASVHLREAAKRVRVAVGTCRSNVDVIGSTSGVDDQVAVSPRRCDIDVISRILSRDHGVYVLAGRCHINVCRTDAGVQTDNGNASDGDVANSRSREGRVRQRVGVAAGIETVVEIKLASGSHTVGIALDRQADSRAGAGTRSSGTHHTDVSQQSAQRPVAETNSLRRGDVGHTGGAGCRDRDHVGAGLAIEFHAAGRAAAVQSERVGVIAAIDLREAAQRASVAAVGTRGHDVHVVHAAGGADDDVAVGARCGDVDVISRVLCRDVRVDPGGRAGHVDVGRTDRGVEIQRLDRHVRDCAGARAGERRRVQSVREGSRVTLIVQVQNVAGVQRVRVSLDREARRTGIVCVTVDCDCTKQLFE